MNPTNQPRTLVKALSLCFAVILILTLALGLYTPGPVQAGGMVASCDEASLLAALNSNPTVTFTCDGTITLSSTINITTDTTIDGSGHNVTISGGDKVSLFNVNGAAFTVKNLTFANAGPSSFNNNTPTPTPTAPRLGSIMTDNTPLKSNSRTSVGSSPCGGAITTNANLTVVNINFTNNKTGCEGGAIYHSGNSLATVTNSTFINNRAYLYGGAVYNGIGNASLIVTNSTFLNNSNYANPEYGGAITNEGANNGIANLTVANSTFVGNYSSLGGGAIANRATSNGNTANLTVTNSTFVNNSSGNYGGSIFNYPGLGTTKLYNNLFVNNENGNCSFFTPNVSVANLEFPGSVSCGAGSSVAPTNPLSAAGLADNGGPTQTIALAASASNPAIDKGDPAYCPSTDQRNALRSGTCDIGAFEMVFPQISKAFGTNALDVNKTTSLTFTLTNPDLRTLTGLTFSDTLPSGLTVATPNGLNNGCGGTVMAIPDSNSISLTDGTIGPGANCTITLNIKGTAPGMKNNTTGAIATTETGSGKTSNTATLTVCESLVVDKIQDDINLCGTLRHSLSNAQDGDTINIQLSATPATISLNTNGLKVPQGVNINGLCKAGKPAIILDGTGMAGDGLVLNGRNSLLGLEVKGFGGRQIYATGSNNHLSCVIARLK